MLQRELATQYFINDQADGKKYERARALYYANFACFMTMRKNGEYDEYCRFKVPKYVEEAWSTDVKERLMEEICREGNLLQVVNLSRVNVPEGEILDAFRTLVSCSLREKVLLTIKRLEALFEKELYKKIVQLFESG